MPQTATTMIDPSHARAMAESTRFGRKPKMTKHQAREALKHVAAGEPMREIALSYNVDHSTISRAPAAFPAHTYGRCDHYPGYAHDPHKSNYRLGGCNRRPLDLGRSDCGCGSAKKMPSRLTSRPATPLR